VQAFGFDERAVRDWWRRSGQHCRAVHEYKVERHPLDLKQAQADEIKVKRQEGHFWMALVMMVPTRLWFGGVVSARRDLDLIQTLSDKIKAMALCWPLLLTENGFIQLRDRLSNLFSSRTASSQGGARPSQVGSLARGRHRSSGQAADR
jgi:hypothetical protein